MSLKKRAMCSWSRPKAVEALRDHYLDEPLARIHDQALKGDQRSQSGGPAQGAGGCSRTIIARGHRADECAALAYCPTIQSNSSDLPVHRVPVNGPLMLGD
jgi:hypothetical protein